MRYMRIDEIRENFLSFFEARGHLRLPSFPLIPKNDNSLLLINSGMAPLKPYFTGQEIPPRARVATSQKCIRTNDIDEVGKDARHGSFFEMLGNFSFGDYFKADAIPWAWEFLTEAMGFPVEKLSVSVYEEDGEAFDIWHKTVGLPTEKIYKFGKSENFWEHGAGPCGPCSEIFFDRGAEYGCGRPECAPGCDCDRFMEVWNLVFTQFNKREDGGYDPLESRNIDTGMGLERMAIVMQGASSIFEIDTIKTIREKVKEITGAGGGANAEVSLNIIADHARSITFMAADGVLPSNEGRGYVLRRLLRRAVRHGRLLGYERAFIKEAALKVIAVYGDAYPELTEKSGHVLLVLQKEEARFLETLDTGLHLLHKKISELKKGGANILPGADAFTLYDTYGFPLELTQEILSDENIGLDETGFTGAMDAQKQRARAARGSTNYMGAEETVYHKLPPGMVTEFAGYTQSTAEGRVLAIVLEGSPRDGGGEITDSAAEGQSVSLFLDRTSFYAESGGQKSDAGVLENARCLIEIRDCIKVAGGNVAHRGVVKRGAVKTGETVKTVIDANRRLNTARNHTATHLLQKALREILGAHVEQAGSDVSAERLRFDFTHFSPLTPEEKQKVETRVNELILAGLNVAATEMPVGEARKLGAMALFGEKYGDTVRVVNIGERDSLELCGGTHLSNTRTAVVFKLLSESGVASGIRRIEALTGEKALAYFREADARLTEAAAVLKTTADRVAERAAALAAEVKQLQRELAKARTQGAASGDSLEDLLKNTVAHNGLKLLSARADNLDANALRLLSDKLRDKVDAFILGSVNNGAVQFIAAASEAAIRQGVNAGQVVKEAAVICGGNGGGRPNSAQAGGKDAARTDEALNRAMEIMKR